MNSFLESLKVSTKPGQLQSKCKAILSLSAKTRPESAEIGNVERNGTLFATIPLKGVCKTPHAKLG